MPKVCLLVGGELHGTTIFRDAPAQLSLTAEYQTESGAVVKTSSPALYHLQFDFPAYAVYSSSKWAPPSFAVLGDSPRALRTSYNHKLHDALFVAPQLPRPWRWVPRLLKKPDPGVLVYQLVPVPIADISTDDGLGALSEDAARRGLSAEIDAGEQT